VAAAERCLSAAFGRPAARVGSGGAVPLVAVLAETYPQAEIVAWGACDEAQSRVHVIDESVDLADVERMALAEALLPGELGSAA
jgi:acetylornithine deacetylase/succinyl-diaminopimelate desuccinylase-like protein